VVAAFLAAREDELSDPAFASKVLISVALGALATYTARQSARHRRREEAARAIQLDLTAFGPFIEPLPEDRQIAERVKMADKTFGRPLLPEDHDHGPSWLARLRPGAQQQESRGPPES
jgi:hypothetical protein